MTDKVTCIGTGKKSFTSPIVGTKRERKPPESNDVGGSEYVLVHPGSRKLKRTDLLLLEWSSRKSTALLKTGTLNG